MIDRAFQREILEAAQRVYPQGIGDPTKEFQNVPKQKLWANIQYLMEHELVQGVDAGTMGDPVCYLDMTITARGIDFLCDDGGLSAILGTITVRFEENQFREMLAARIENMEGPDNVKADLLASLKSLPAEALKAVALRALMGGLDHLPSIDAVRKWLFS